jgi:plastocyanin
MRRLTVAGIGALLATAIATGFVIAADQTVSIEGFAFSPATVTVQVGDSVTWTNADATAHTATAGDGSFDTESIGPGESSTIAFDTAGTYAYVCSIHPTMSGTVVVEAAGGPAPTDDGGGAGITPAPTDTLARVATESDAGDWLVSAALAVLGTVMLVSTLVADRRFRGGRD